jgi:glycine cleavage system aminomethyltransferase T
MTANERALSALPLHSWWGSLSQTNDWTERNGFTVPAILTSLDSEYAALSVSAGLSDNSWHSVVSIKGEDALEFAQRAFIREPRRQASHASSFVCWTNDEGWVRGTGTLASAGEDELILISECDDYAWLHDASVGFSVEVRNVTGELAGLRFLGPKAESCLAELGLDAPGDRSAAVAGGVRFERILVLPVRDQPLAIDVWVNTEDGLAFAKSALTACCGTLTPAGALAAEIARIEAGALRAGVDWTPVQLALGAEDALAPASLGFGAFNAAPGDRIFQGNDHAAPKFIPVLAHLVVAPDLNRAAPVRHRPSGLTWTSSAFVPTTEQILGIGWVAHQTAKIGAIVDGGRILRILATEQAPRST